MDDQIDRVPGRDRDAARPPAQRQPSPTGPEGAPTPSVASAPGDRRWRFDDAVAAARRVSAATGRR